ncbi:putative disease resistance protein RPP1, partial [Mucuna pruriens]
MKFSNQHLSAPNHHHLENYNNYDDNYCSYQAIYVYPRSGVPEWLEYKSTTDYIIIDISSAPPSLLLGFIFYFVLGFEFNITISYAKGEGKKDSVTMYIDYSGYRIGSDHMCVMYDQRCSDFLNIIAKNQTRFTIKIKMKARNIIGDTYHPVLQPVLKGFMGEEEKPMSYNNTSQTKYDIFVSFRGQDIRNGFLSHLIDFFQRKKINAFVDDKPERGGEIWPSLVRAIKGSFISLIIFSPDYAFSRWCLEELVAILECREIYGQIVIPVFYHVEPTDVRHQLGRYKYAFAEHAKKYETQVQIWRHSLNKSADLSGIQSSKFQNDAELLKEIINIVLTRLGNPLVNSKGLIDIDKKVEDVESLIHKEPKDTRLIGIWDNFGSGSRIIVTTRDEQVLNANKANEIYLLRQFSSNKALQLFNLNAFNQSDHQMEYDELSKRVVDYAKGIPLVLKVWVYLLRGKDKKVWESELNKLEKMPLPKVYDVMKLSYDDLDRKEKQIFLDLACFFLRSNITVNVANLKSLLKDGEPDNSVVVGLERLKDKALITFSEDNFVSMHDSLQEMGCEIVRRESREDLGSYNRLWDPHDIYETFKTEKGMEAIRSIRIHLPTFKKQKLSPQIFAKMSRLQFLEISGEYNYDCYNQLDSLAEGLEFLATDLRFLCWYYFPLNFLPKNFSA